MDYHLITRNDAGSSPALEYLALDKLADGYAHGHSMPVVGPTNRHGHTDAIDPDEYFEDQYRANHTHELSGCKTHTHAVTCGEAQTHGHNESSTQHKHTVRSQEVHYLYSVTRITGGGTPDVTPDVGVAATFIVPQVDGDIFTDTADNTIQVALADVDTFGAPVLGDSAQVLPSSVDGVTGDSSAPIYVRFEISPASIATEGTGSATSDDLHKGVIGASPAVLSTEAGDHQSSVQSKSDWTSSLKIDGVEGADNGLMMYFSNSPGEWENDGNTVYIKFNAGLSAWEILLVIGESLVASYFRAGDPVGEYAPYSPLTSHPVVRFVDRPAISYPPVKAFQSSAHWHGLTVTPSYGSFDHGHEGTCDYVHHHEGDRPKHSHESTVTQTDEHTHRLTLTNHSHDPLIRGIWRSADVLSNITFTRVDNLSPWILDSVDTIEVQYPSEPVNQEVDDVSWPVDILEDLIIKATPLVQLVADVDVTAVLVEGAGTEPVETEDYTIPAIPYESATYEAGSPEIHWETGAKTSSDKHNGVLGAAAGTPEEQSLVSTLDADTRFLCLDSDGVLCQIKCGKLPSGVPHDHTFTDAPYNLPDHQHELAIHGRTTADLDLSYAHTHSFLLGSPHTHPDKTAWSPEAHYHFIDSIDEPTHTHNVRVASGSTPFAYDIDNVSGDTFDLVTSSKTIFWPTVSGAGSGDTGGAVVAVLDRNEDHLVATGDSDPSMNGNYFLAGVDQYDGSQSRRIVKFEGNWIIGIWSDALGYFTVSWSKAGGDVTGTYTGQTGTVMVAVREGVSALTQSGSQTVGGTPVEAVPADDSITLSGYTEEAGDDYVSSASAGDHPIEDQCFTISSGAVSMTMTGAADEKLHNGI